MGQYQLWDRDHLVLYPLISLSLSKATDTIGRFCLWPCSILIDPHKPTPTIQGWISSLWIPHSGGQISTSVWGVNIQIHSWECQRLGARTSGVPLGRSDFSGDLDKGHLYMLSFYFSVRVPRQRKPSRGCSTSGGAGHGFWVLTPPPTFMLSLLGLPYFPQDEALKSSSKQPFIIPA